MSVGKRLVEERERLGLNQIAMATACAVSKKGQFNFETDANLPGGSYLIAADQLGVDVAYVLTGRSPSLSRVNMALLRACISGVEEGLSQIKSTLPATKKAELIARIYELHQTARSPPQKATILQFIKKAA